MRASTIAAVSAALVGQTFAEAPASTGNPTGVAYKASFGDVEGELMGSVYAVAGENGEGVQFTVHFENLPEEGSPFGYHLHKEPVPADGNCSLTLTHLDPFGAGAVIPCDSSAPQTCEVGDLSGKHGKVDSDPFDAEYSDSYPSIVEGDASFFGNRSFVLHFANTSRIACANFEMEEIPSTPCSNCTTTVYPPTATGTGGLPIPTPTGGDSAPVPGAAAGQVSAWSLPLMLAGGLALAFGL